MPDTTTAEIDPVRRRLAGGSALALLALATGCGGGNTKRSSDAVLQNGRWSVDVGLPVDISGKVTNASGQTQWSGDEKVVDRAPFDAPGLYHVSFRVTGSGGATPCTGSVWVEVGGSPVGTPLWIGGVAVLLLGAADVAWAVAAALKGVGV